MRTQFFTYLSPEWVGALVVVTEADEVAGHVDDVIEKLLKVLKGRLLVKNVRRLGRKRG